MPEAPDLLHRRRCVFCEQPRKISGEHVWPKWIRKVLHPETGSYTATRSIVDPLGQVVSSDSWPAGSPYDTQVKAPCRDCNHGWMNGIEVAARDVLTDLMLNKGRPLITKKEQLSLSRWATKTAMMLQFLQPKARLIPDGDLTRFYKSQRPISGSRISIIAYSGPLPGDVYRHVALHNRSSQRFGGAIPEPDGYLSTFVVGRVAFQLHGKTGPTRQETVIAVDPAVRHQIWPYPQRSLSWPTQEIIRSVDGLMNVMLPSPARD
jgi:hypothetical protein